MLGILNSLNAIYFPIFQPILMIFVSKVMVLRALSDKTYLSLGFCPLYIKKPEKYQICIMDLVIEESLSYCLAGLRYSPLAYLTFICLYPFIRWLKISST